MLGSRKTIVVAILLGLYLVLLAKIWQPVVLGLLFASACAPGLRRLQNMLKSRRSALAYATATLSILLFLVVLVYLGFRTYSFLFQLSENPETFAHINEQVLGLKEKAVKWLSEKGFWSAEEISQQLNRWVASGTEMGRDLLVNVSKALFTQTPQILLSFTIFFLAYCAFLLGGTRVLILAGKKFGWDVQTAQAKFETVCALTLGSVILTSLMQAAVVTVGAAIAGLSSLFLIFLVTFLCSMVPVLGAASVPLVLAAFQLFGGAVSDTIILVITAAIAGTADNVLKAYLFSRAAKTNPLVSLIVLIGGIALLGFPGLFVAPVVEQLLMTELEEKS